MNSIEKKCASESSQCSVGANELLPLVYDELKRLASAKLAQEKPGQTLQPTALVHEAYLRLTGKNNNRRWKSKAHFFFAAASAIRCILIDQARKKAGPKAGGSRIRVTYSDLLAIDCGPSVDVVELNEALDKLESIEPRAAQMVNLRFFIGLSREECSELLDVSVSTADKDWAYAKAWLRRELSDGFDGVRTGEMADHDKAGQAPDFEL